MSQKLMPGAQAPSLKLPLVGGGTFDLAAEKPENFTMVLFYRGYHCPVCKGYLGPIYFFAFVTFEKWTDAID